jgi:hypothetical protein
MIPCSYDLADIETGCYCNVQWGDTEIGTLCNSKDNAHIAANFDSLPSARKLLFIHEILDKKSLLCPQHVYQISKLED